MLTENQTTRYSRHILLPEFGAAEQERLLSAKVLIIGMGGLGSVAAYYLAASGIGTLYLSDNELVELSNLQRQILYRTEDIGNLKTTAAKKNLLALNPEITIISLPGLSNISSKTNEYQTAFSNADVVLDCTDNFPSRYAINELCIKFKIPLISGSAIAWQGQVATFPLQLENSPCYACLYPPIKEQAIQQPSCADSGVISPLVGNIGSMQALATLLMFKSTMDNAQLVRFNARNLQSATSTIILDPFCSCHE